MKCKVMHLSSKDTLGECLMDRTLDTVVETKDLGVLIDNELKFHKHVTTAVAKANQTLCIIKKDFWYIRQGITTYTLQTPGQIWPRISKCYLVSSLYNRFVKS